MVDTYQSKTYFMTVVCGTFYSHDLHKR